MTVTQASYTPAGADVPPSGEVIADVVIDKVENLASDVIRLTLCAADDAPLPAWTPGAHIDVVLDDAMVRQYSLCGDPADRHRWQVAVRRVPDGSGGSVRLHDQAKRGAVLAIRGPRNNFPLIEAPRYVFLAGGIGITPLLPMIARLSHLGATWQMHYGGQTRASMPFLDELSIYGDNLVIRSEDVAGMLDLPAACADLAAGTAIYCCGPESMIAAAEQLLNCRDDVTLYVERFAPKQIVASSTDTAFEVYCTASDLTLEIPPGKSILEVAQEAGLDVLSSCGEGTCGTCEVDVVDGLPDHRDSFLTPRDQESNESMMICVSRCRGTKLVIDI